MTAPSANPITFSTLACPEWPRETVVAQAAEFGYDGIEWRGGSQGHVQPAMSSIERARLRRSMSDAGLSAIAVTAYTTFVSDDPAERSANVDELRRYADLAADLGARYVRAFLGELNAEARPGGVAAVRERIASCLDVAARHAQAAGVQIAVEPHDEFVRSSSVAPILERVTHPAVGVIWDIGNAFAAGEEPQEGFQLLGRRLSYVQVKDGLGRGSGWRLTPLGQGEVPLAGAFEMLLSSGYRGAFSLEWERAWHPELDPPEVALPAALRTMRALLAAAQAEAGGPSAPEPV